MSIDINCPGSPVAGIMLFPLAPANKGDQDKPKDDGDGLYG